MYWFVSFTTRVSHALLFQCTGVSHMHWCFKCTGVSNALALAICIHAETLERRLNKALCVLQAYFRLSHGRMKSHYFSGFPIELI